MGLLFQELADKMRCQAPLGFQITSCIVYTQICGMDIYIKLI